MKTHERDSQRWARAMFVVGLLTALNLMVVQTATADTTRTTTLTGTGFTIDVPARWHSASEVLRAGGRLESAVTILAAVPTDIAEDRATRGERIVLDLFPMVAIKPYSGADQVNTERRHEELVEFFRMFYGWERIESISGASLFGEPALMVHVQIDGRPCIQVIGYAPFTEIRESAYSLMLEAASASQLERFLPTWHAMLESVQPMAGRVVRTSATFPMPASQQRAVRS